MPRSTAAPARRLFQRRSPHALALAGPAVCRWRSCWPPCCRRWISTCANTICRRRRSSSNKGGSPSCRTTSTPTWRWAPRCSACWRWSSPAIGGGAPWRARPSSPPSRRCAPWHCTAAGRRFYSTSAGVAAALVYISIPWVAVDHFVGRDVSGWSRGRWRATCSWRSTPCCWPADERDSCQPPAAACRSTHPTGLLILAGYLAGAAVATKYPAVLFVLLPLAVWAFFGRLGASASGQGSGIRGQDWKSASIRDLEPWPPNPEPYPLGRRCPDGIPVGRGGGLRAVVRQELGPDRQSHLSAALRSLRRQDVERRKGRQMESRPPPGRLLRRNARQGLGPRGSDQRVAQSAGRAVGGVGACWAGHARPLRLARLAWELLVYVAFVVAVWWLFTHRIDRFWIPVLPVLALLAGAGACWNSDRWWRWLLKGLLLAGLGANFLVAAAGPGNAWFVPLEQLRNDAALDQPLAPVFQRRRRRRRGAGGRRRGRLRPEAARPLQHLFRRLHLRAVGQGQDGPARFGPSWRRGTSPTSTSTGARSPAIARTYGFTDFVQPEVFDRLVEQGVLGAAAARPRDLSKPIGCYRAANIGAE